MGSTGIDIRFPIGLLFALLGVIITAWGIIAPKASMSEGYNVNLYWGIVLLAFGVVMLLLGSAAHKRRVEEAKKVEVKPPTVGATGLGEKRG